MKIEIISILIILCLAFIQNISFSIVSRSRNRNNIRYHLIAAFFSNTIWFLTFRQLVKADMTFILFIPYCIGTMLGSVFGVKISMWIEKLLGAAADGHLGKINSKVTANDLAAYWEYLEKMSMSKFKPMKFKEWLKIYKKDLMCPVCKIHELDSHRGVCIDCSH
jgi:hypothetical protein